MKNQLVIFCIAILLASSFSSLFATHVKGGHLEYTCINGCTTEIKLVALRGCGSGISINYAQINVSGIGTSCNQAVPLGAWSVQTITEITPICPGFLTNCNAGTLWGIESRESSRSYDLCNMNCSTVNISWTDCCRNTGITTGAGNQTQYMFTALDLSNGCNQSPDLRVNPRMYICAGQLSTMHLGGYDPDGDSLAYYLGPCMQSASLPCTYLPTCSPTAPLGNTWSVSLDSSTGDLTCIPTPGNTEVGILCYYVEEWRNGVLIGTMMRELEIVVVTCAANDNPVLLPPANIVGGLFGGVDTLYAFPGQQVCFEIGTNDPNAGQILDLTWNGYLAGASFTNLAGTPMDTVSGTNPTARFCYTPATAGNYLATFFVNDDMCPLYGLTTHTLTIIATNNPPILGGSATAIPTACNVVQFAASGIGGTPPYTYAWTGGGGISNNPNNTDSVFAHTFVDAGQFPVQVMITDAAFDTLIWNDTVSVDNYVQGFVTTSTGANLQNQQILLVHYDPTDSSLTSTDTSFTDNSGYFEFCTPDTLVYVKATPDSATYPTQMPTYADTALAWQNARGYALNGTGTTLVIFSTKFGSNPGGPGFIGGLIVNGANKQNDPVVGLELILMGPGGYPYGRTTTNQDGYFNFPNIPVGDYEVWVDKPHIDNGNAPDLTLTAQMEIQDSLLFVLHDEWLELEMVTQNELPLPLESLTIAPNPFEDRVEVSWTLTAPAIGTAEIVDLFGKTIFQTDLEMRSAGDYHKEFDLATVTPGIYFLRINTGQESVVSKLIKK